MQVPASGASRRLVLASASPRRRELLADLGLSFDVIPGDVEEMFKEGMPSETVARDLALAKAESVATRCPDAVVLAADTLVVVGEDEHEVILGKPESEDHARWMLRMLSGAVHRVVTGVAVVWMADDGCRPVGSQDRRRRVEVVTTRVQFRCLDAEAINAYIATGDPMDKAGGYGIQGGAASFVERVEGDYFNVVGLSLRAVVTLLDGLIAVPGNVPDPPAAPFPIVP